MIGIGAVSYVAILLVSVAKQTSHHEFFAPLVKQYVNAIQCTKLIALYFNG